MGQEREALIEMLKHIDWNQQYASTYSIGEDAAQEGLMCLGFDFEMGISNESVDAFLTALDPSKKGQ